MLHFAPKPVETDAAQDWSASERRADYLLRKAINDRRRFERMASGQRRLIAKIRKTARDFDIPLHR